MPINKLPTRARPAGLLNICREIKNESVTFDDLAERLPLERDDIEDNLDYGNSLGFIQSDANSIRLTDRGLSLAYQDGISDSVWPIFEEGIRDSGKYTELTQTVASENDDDSELSQTTILRLLRVRFDVDMEEPELKSAVNSYLLTLEATGIGEYKLARGGVPTRLELRNEMRLLDLLNPDTEVRALVKEAERLSADDFPAFSDYDDELESRCLPQFYQGLYQEAVSTAFTVLEDRVRNEGGFTPNESGADLMSQAFDKSNGPLQLGVIDNEKEGFKLLYMGAFRALRNPPHHRLLDDMDQPQARDMLGFVNLLLTLIENRN